MAKVIFKDKKVDLEKLQSFGFTKNDLTYNYQTSIVEGQFQLKIEIDEQGQLETQVIDTATQDEYVLHLTAGASGEFVGKVSEAYQEVLHKIEKDCYENDSFKSQQAQDIIQYIKNNYDDELEFLWKNLPLNAIWRRTDTNKWYGLLSVIPKSKLGLKSEEVVTVLDLWSDPDKIENLVDNIKYFPGYHMSKKSWFTIILDGSIDNSEIIERLRDSYLLAK